MVLFGVQRQFVKKLVVLIRIKLTTCHAFRIFLPFLKVGWVI
jgi:hypothetical protein